MSKTYDFNKYLNSTNISKIKCQIKSKTIGVEYWSKFLNFLLENDKSSELIEEILKHKKNLDYINHITKAIRCKSNINIIKNIFNEDDKGFFNVGYYLQFSVYHNYYDAYEFFVLELDKAKITSEEIIQSTIRALNMGLYDDNTTLKFAKLLPLLESSKLNATEVISASNVWKIGKLEKTINFLLDKKLLNPKILSSDQLLYFSAMNPKIVKIAIESKNPNINENVIDDIVNDRPIVKRGYASSCTYEKYDELIAFILKSNLYTHAKQYRHWVYACLWQDCHYSVIENIYLKIQCKQIDENRYAIIQKAVNICNKKRTAWKQMCILKYFADVSIMIE